jgi:polyvinyl alcohol dehydrogenase (cytochrome)
MNWTKPNFENNRFGFEVTMYVSLKTNHATQTTCAKNQSQGGWLRHNLKALALLGLTGSVLANGVDLQNTHSFKGGPINKHTVGQLQLKWEYLTVPDTGTVNAAMGSISSIPAVDGNYLYFNDLSGNLTKLNRFTGAVVWKKNYVTDLSAPGYIALSSRVTPYIKGNLLIVGSNLGLLQPLCFQTGEMPSALGCASGDGAIVLAIDKNTGVVQWRTTVDPHPSAKITGSISGHGNRIFVPVANWEEDFARGKPNIFVKPIDPNSPYPCCSARGSLVAIDLNSHKILWQRHTTIGNGDKPDLPNEKLSPELKALLTPQGFWGASAYGNNPTIDIKRRQIYIATAETTTAPKVAQECEQARRATHNPNANISGLPNGVTCNNLNEKLRTYANAMVAIDMDTGKVKWAFYAHKYDAWNHACGAPDFYGWSAIVPFVFPVPRTNVANCTMDPIGPDVGFGQMPMLIKHVKLRSGKKGDVVVAGNKDGRLFALDPDTGKKLWETNTDPGGIYGGLQFGIASDEGKIFFGTTNSSNENRKINPKPNNPLGYVPVDDFLIANGFTEPPLVLKTGPFVKEDAATPVPYPAPSSQNLPFPGPNLVFGITDYPNSYPDPDGIGGPDGFLKGPASGPVELWTLVNPPSDVEADGFTVFQDGNHLTTINGMVQAVDAGTGKILWQRPANDGIKGTLNNGQAFGKVVVGNGVVFVGYADSKGTMVGLSTKTGKKLFEFHQMITLSDGSKIPAGSIEGAPQVVGDMLYWGAGNETGSFFPNREFINVNAGNRLYGFKLPENCSENHDDD